MKSNLFKSQIKLFPYGLADRVNRSKYGDLSFLIVILIGVITLFIWILNRMSIGIQPLMAVAKSSALIGICLLSLTIILSLRLSLIESLFGGLDVVYKAHHLIGQIAFIVIFFHPLFLLINSIQNLNLILFYFMPGKHMPYTLGTISFLLIVLLLFFTLLVNLPYKLWHFSHKFMGVALILSTWHALLSGTDLNQYPILKVWIVLIAFIGIFSYFYMLFLYQLIGPKHKAFVKHVETKGDITEIKFLVKKKFRFHPGQFVFIKFINLEKSFEIFPFSISSSPNEELVRISAKKSGDFTSYTLPKLSVGDQVLLYGPYGKFGEKVLFGNKNMIWIAGGIGITPFLSMINQKINSNIDFFWTCKDRKDAVYDDEIKNILRNRNNIKYRLWISTENGRLSAEVIIKSIGANDNICEKLIFICGPTQMMMDLANQFVEIGIRPRNIIFEDFNLL